MSARIDAALASLAETRAALDEHHAAKVRMAGRLTHIANEVNAAQTAAVDAAASATPDDDVAAVRTLSDARERLVIIQEAVAKNETASARTEESLAARVKDVASARASHELEQAIAVVPAFQTALAGLVDSVATIEAHVMSARQHAASAGIPLSVPHYIGRRIRHDGRGCCICRSHHGQCDCHA